MIINAPKGISMPQTLFSGTKYIKHQLLYI